MNNDKGFLEWLQGQYVYESNAITGDVVVGERGYYTRKHDYDHIERMTIKINSPEWEAWKKERYEEYNGKYKQLVEREAAKSINTKTMMGLLKKHPRNKEAYEVYMAPPGYRESTSKKICLLSRKTKIIYLIDCEKLFSEREIVLSYCYKRFRETYYSKEKEEFYDTLPATNYEKREQDKQKYKRFFEIYFPEEIDQIFDAIEFFEENYGIEELESHLDDIKNELQLTINQHFHGIEYLVDKSANHLKEIYKDNPDKILTEFLDPTLLKIYNELKNK